VLRVTPSQTKQKRFNAKTPRREDAKDWHLYSLFATFRLSGFALLSPATTQFAASSEIDFSPTLCFLTKQMRQNGSLDLEICLLLATETT